MRTQLGFTLAEVIITIVLIGILAAAFARVSVNNGASDQALRSSTMALESSVNVIRDNAMKTNLRHKIIFNIGANTYNSYVENSASNSWQKLETSQPFPAGVTIGTTTLANHQIIFDATAVPHEDPVADNPDEIDDPLATNKTIQIDHSSGTTTNITIYAETGYVQNPY